MRKVAGELYRLAQTTTCCIIHYDHLHRFVGRIRVGNLNNEVSTHILFAVYTEFDQHGSSQVMEIDALHTCSQTPGASLHGSCSISEEQNIESIPPWKDEIYAWLAGNISSQDASVREK
jgi:hypothetical protein